MVGIAALLHDVKRAQEDSSRGTMCHAQEGARFALQFLQARGFSPQMAAHIAACIRTHRYRGERTPETIEAQVLFDADKLDSLGAIGVARAFHFAGQIDARLHSRSDSAMRAAPYSEDDTAYREFLVKLGHIGARLYTDQARRLANDRYRFTAAFFDRLRQEVEGLA